MFVGISERTNEAGADFLSKAFGASLPVIPVPVVSDSAMQYGKPRKGRLRSTGKHENPDAFVYKLA